jgi:hypothetical protein
VWGVIEIRSADKDFPLAVPFTTVAGRTDPRPHPSTELTLLHGARRHVDGLGDIGQGNVPGPRLFWAGPAAVMATQSIGLACRGAAAAVVADAGHRC